MVPTSTIAYTTHFDAYLSLSHEVFVALLYWGILCFAAGSMEICPAFGFAWLDCSLEDAFIDGWIVVEDFRLVSWSSER